MYRFSSHNYNEAFVNRLQSYFHVYPVNLVAIYHYNTL